MAKPVDILIAERLGDIDQKLTLVLANQKEFRDELEGKMPIIPELEKAIKQTGVLTHRIDRQVPDKPLRK